MESQKQLSDIFSRYMRNECSPEEIKVLLRHFEIGNNEQLLRELIHAEFKNHAATITSSEDKQVFDRVFHRITAEIEAREQTPVAVKKRRFSWLSAAAILLATSTAGLIFYFNQQQSEVNTRVTSKPALVKNDIEPGGNKAILTLSDGRVIDLNDTKNGVIATQNKTSISKTTEGEIEYSSIEVNSRQPVYNTISTPRGGEFKITLPDGTKVWLNASSSLKFPTAFSGHQRNVELTGEGYFEVARDETMPFRVFAQDTEIEVLGTHFNVMAYNDEPELKATLLEGSVKVMRADQSKTLFPGEQAKVNNKITVIHPAEDAIAWKKGFVSFENMGIESIMRQIARWYDVDVTYQGRIKPRLFTGTIRKNIKLSELLKVLQANDIQFRVNDRNITVIH